MGWLSQGVLIICTQALLFNVPVVLSAELNCNKYYSSVLSSALCGKGRLWTQQKPIIELFRLEKNNKSNR